MEEHNTRFILFYYIIHNLQIPIIQLFLISWWSYFGSLSRVTIMRPDVSAYHTPSIFRVTYLDLVDVEVVGKQGVRLLYGTLEEIWPIISPNFPPL